MVEDFVASASKAQKLLNDLCVNITTPAECLRTSHDDSVGGMLGSEGPA